MRTFVNIGAMWTLVNIVGCRAVDVQPTSVAGILGPIRVEYVADPVVEGDSVWGAFEPAPRRIIVDAGVTAIAFRRNIIAHERCHSAFVDLGIALPDATEEQVCNAMAALEVAR